jgi:hypothetical protein
MFMDEGGRFSLCRVMVHFDGFEGLGFVCRVWRAQMDMASSDSPDAISNG